MNFVAVKALLRVLTSCYVMLLVASVLFVMCNIHTYSGLLNTAHGCSQHGPAAAWLTSEWAACVIPVPKISTLFWVWKSPAIYETVFLKRTENVCSCVRCASSWPPRVVTPNALKWFKLSDEGNAYSFSNIYICLLCLYLFSLCCFKTTSTGSMWRTKNI